MALGRPMPPLVLSDDEVQQFQGIASSRSLPHSIVQRAQIVLACGAGESNTAIAKRMGPCLASSPLAAGQLDCRRTAAAPPEIVQALHRSVLCGEGPRHRRSLLEPTGQGDGALRRREDAGRGPPDIGQPFFRLPKVSLREFCLILAWLMQACHDEQIVPGKPMRLILLLWLADTLTIFWRAGDRSRLPAHSEYHFCCCV